MSAVNFKNKAGYSDQHDSEMLTDKSPTSMDYWRMRLGKATDS